MLATAAYKDRMILLAFQVAGIMVKAGSFLLRTNSSLPQGCLRLTVEGLLYKVP